MTADFLHHPKESKPVPTQIDRAVIERVDRWFGGALCIAFKQSDIGLPNTPITYLYRSDVLAGLGVTEEPFDDR